MSSTTSTFRLLVCVCFGALSPLLSLFSVLTTPVSSLLLNASQSSSGFAGNLNPSNGNGNGPPQSSPQSSPQQQPFTSIFTSSRGFEGMPARGGGGGYGPLLSEPLLPEVNASKSSSKSSSRTNLSRMLH